MWLFLLFACTPDVPTDGPLELPPPEVQRAWLVDCEAEASTTYGEGIEYLWRDLRYDRWGNLVFSEIDDEQGGFSILEATFHGGVPLTRDLEDHFRSPTITESDVYTWSGPFLDGLITTRSGVVERYTFSSDGDHPYDEAEVDTDDDGSIDRIETTTWRDGLRIREEQDHDADGSIDRTVRWEYDADGRITLELVEDISGAYTRLEQEWLGPYDILVRSRRETFEGEGPTVVAFAEGTVSEDGSTVVTPFFIDGELQETRTAIYEDGRIQSQERAFPEGSFADTLETWTWDCPSS